MELLCTKNFQWKQLCINTAKSHHVLQFMINFTLFCFLLPHDKCSLFCLIFICYASLGFSWWMHCFVVFCICNASSMLSMVISLFGMILVQNLMLWFNMTNLELIGSLWFKIHHFGLWWLFYYFMTNLICNTSLWFLIFILFFMINSVAFCLYCFVLVFTINLLSLPHFCL